MTLLPPDFVPTKPSYAAAQDAYQFFLELKRRHPDDSDVAFYFKQAEALLGDLHRERAL